MTTPPDHNAHDLTQADDGTLARGVAGSVATNLLIAASFIHSLEAALRVAALIMSVGVSALTIHAAFTKKTKNKEKHEQRSTEQP